MVGLGRAGSSRIFVLNVETNFFCSMDYVPKINTSEICVVVNFGFTICDRRRRLSTASDASLRSESLANKKTLHTLKMCNIFFLWHTSKCAFQNQPNLGCALWDMSHGHNTFWRTSVTAMDCDRTDIKSDLFLLPFIKLTNRFHIFVISIDAKLRRNWAASDKFQIHIKIFIG